MHFCQMKKQPSSSFSPPTERYLIIGSAVPAAEHLTPPGAPINGLAQCRRLSASLLIMSCMIPN